MLRKSRFLLTTPNLFRVRLLVSLSGNDPASLGSAVARTRPRSLRFWERGVEIEREPSPRERSETLSSYTRVGILTLIASPLGLTGIERAGTFTP